MEYKNNNNNSRLFVAVKRSNHIQSNKLSRRTVLYNGTQRTSSTKYNAQINTGVELRYTRARLSISAIISRQIERFIASLTSQGHSSGTPLLQRQSLGSKGSDDDALSVPRPSRIKTAVVCIRCQEFRPFPPASPHVPLDITA